MNHRRTPSSSAASWILLAVVILGLLAWRLAVAWLMPVTLDEAYYFDWSRHLAWGYFDHPPGVALVGLGTLLEPGSAFAARLGGLLAGAATLLVLAVLYRRCGLRDPADLALALVLAGATLPGLAGGILVTPDTPLALGWALALFEAERALAGDRRRWVTAGLAVGLGLLGKYTMVLIGPVLLWAILRADWRALRTPWPYLGALAALLVFLPNILWNASHDWVTMRFQFGHGFSTQVGDLASVSAQTVERTGPESFGERLESLLGYLGAQLGFWGLIAPALIWGLVARLRSRGGAAKPDTPALASHARPLLMAATFFPLGFFALVATFSQVQANWPLMYLLSAAPLAVLWLRPVRVWVYAAAGVNLLLVTLYAYHSATASLPLPDSQNRILRETHGFAELAQRVAELDGPVYVERYQTTAMLRFYRPDLDIDQWPGLTRPSEFVRRHMDEPVVPRGPFWLITRGGPPPAIEGFAVERSRRFFDCAGKPLSETETAPCRRPLHTWPAYRYRPQPSGDPT
ncbi:ArnT family glycosyltransferase [Imhoffiella purpurea]|nr:glycosyltransferase family 39 protein [Imhoffiella purpurea]